MRFDVLNPMVSSLQGGAVYNMLELRDTTSGTSLLKVGLSGAAQVDVAYHSQEFITSGAGPYLVSDFVDDYTTVYASVGYGYVSSVTSNDMNAVSWTSFIGGQVDTSSSLYYLFLSGPNDGNPSAGGTTTNIIISGEYFYNLLFIFWNCFFT